MEEHVDFKEKIRIAVLDVETTGLSVKEDRIIQIAILILDNEARPLKLYDCYFNPGRDVELSKSFHIHKISPDILRNAPSFEAKADEILGVLSDVDIVAGHNVSFDFEFLRYEFNRVLNLDAYKNESESDETWQLGKKSNAFENQSTKVEEFDRLKFKLLDTYRLSLIAIPNQKSYSLLALSKHLGIQVKMFQVTGYKWGSKIDNSENVFNAGEKVENMREHNAVTDVLETEQLLKKCLKILNIGYSQIIGGECERFEIVRQLILTADKLIEKKVLTNDELIQLVRLAPDQMNVNFPERSKCLKDLNAADLNTVISFLSTRQYQSDKRQKLICQGFLQVALDKEKFNKVFKEIREDKRKKLQDFNDGRMLEKIEKVKDPASLKGHGKLETESQQKDSCDITDKSPPTEMAIKKQCRPLNISDDGIPNKFSRHCDKEEGNIAADLITNSYEDETEEYSFPKEYKEMSSLKGESHGNCELLTLTKNSVVQFEKWQQEVVPMTDTEDSFSGSILTENHRPLLNSQEYPIAKGNETTPEKNHKQGEELKKMRMFSPTF